MQRIYTLTFLLLALVPISKAQIVINEFSAANKSNYTAANGQYYDWIELYNGSGSTVSIGGWYISDNPSALNKWQIPAGLSIANNSYKIFFCSALDGIVSGQYHTNFKMTQSDTSEHIILSNPSLTIIDSLTVFPCDSNDSRGRTTNGAATWGIFVKPTPNASNNTQTCYPAYVPKVQFSLPAGFYAGAQSVTLSCSQANTTIRYTIDGSQPKANSPVYSAAITVNATKVIRARAFDNTNGNVPSFTESNTYFINESHTLPVVSVCGNQLDGQLGNGSLSVEFGNLEFFSTASQQVFEIGGEFSPHGNDSWAYNQRGFDFNIEDQYGTGDLIHKQIFYTSPRKKFKWLIFKAAASDNFPDGGSNPPTRCAHIRDMYVQTLAEKFHMNVDLRRADHVLMYVNGQYWGVYEIREKVDDDYFDYYYNQPEGYADNLRYWGGLQIISGSDTAWNNLYNFVVSNNLTVPANYTFVTDRLNVMSLIDAIALGLYCVDSDWLDWNTAWWRGRYTNPSTVKWKYWLWDEDNVFDLGQDYTGWGNTTNSANPCDINSAGGGTYSDPNIGPDEGHIVIFNKLMTNPDFKALYVNRMADLRNGAFNCTNMLNHLDTMIARIQPEMQRQCTRWSGSYTQWQTNVQYLRNQISGRCAMYNNAFDTCYQVSGPYHLAVDVYPPNAGTVTIGNTVTPTQYVYTSTYFGGVNLSFKATPDTGYVFSHWQTLNHTTTPSNAVDSMYFDMGTQSDSVVAVFTPIDSVSLTVYVNPVGAGNVTVNGTALSAYPTVLKFLPNTPLTVSEIPNVGYSFTNWLALHHTLNPNNTSTSVTFNITQNDTLIANYLATPDSFNLTVLVNPAGGGNVSVNGVTPGSYPAVTHYASGTPLAIVATQNAGYSFANWTILHHTLTPNNTTASAGFSISQSDTLIANFTVIPNPDTFKLTVMVNPTGGGNVSVNGTTPGAYPAIMQFVDGTPLTAIATASTGYTFANYTILHHTLNPNNTSANVTFNITANDTLLANFTVNPDTFNLTVMVNPTGGGSVNVNSIIPVSYPTVLQFVNGTLLSISPMASAGYTFVNWTLLHHILSPFNTSLNATFTITANDTLTANFSTNPDTFNLTVLVNPAGSGNVTLNGSACVSYPTIRQYTGGTAMSINAAANTGYSFTNWTILHHALSPNNLAANAGFTIAQSDTLTAEFNLLPLDSFDIVVNVAPNHAAGKVVVAGITPSGYPWKGRFAQGTNVDFDATGNVFTTTNHAYNYAFDHYDFIYHSPIPNNITPIVFITVQQPDTVVAWFVDEPISTDTTVQIWIPSAFTPDGVNNVFRLHPRSEELADYNMQIYNRWGQKVFESNNQGHGWSGDFNGKPCALGVYSYILIGKRQNGDEVFKKGTVTLIR